MQLIALRKGGVKCSSSCPFHTDRDWIHGVNDVPLKTHCRMVMHPWMADCNIYDVHHIDKMEVSEEEWKKMQQAIGKKATKQIKLYPEDHAEIHPVGWSWKHDRWNAEKSELKITN